MHRSELLRALLLTAGTLASATACNPSSNTATPTSASPAAAVAKAVPQPTHERLLERSAQRWKHICAKEWVEAYDFLTPEQKRILSVAQFLQGKDSHNYANARPLEVLSQVDDMAYVRSFAIWTPSHPSLAKVKLEPGQTLTQELEMMETWRWVDGDWGFVKAERPSDFYSEHPDLLKKTDGSDAAAAEKTPTKGSPR